MARRRQRVFAAVELFTQRAAAADRRFELSPANTSGVAEICRRLDGNPLALELRRGARAGTGTRRPARAARDRFRLLRLTRRQPNPRMALSTAFDWSYSLLPPGAEGFQQKTRHFAGSFSTQFGRSLCADETIDTAEAIDLVDAWSTALS